MNPLKKRRYFDRVFWLLCCSCAMSALLILIYLMQNIIISGYGNLSLSFLTSFPSSEPEFAGIKSALAGTFWLLTCVVFLAVPIGIGSAIFIEEIMPNGIFKKCIQINVANLAGVPSIVYGILGLVTFVRFMHMGRSVLAGACTLTIMILPVIILASQEALKTAPQSLKEAAYAVGGTRLQAIMSHILPLTLPGMLTGVVLAISRAIGEAAPLIIMGGLTYVAFVPNGLLDEFTALPIQIFNWASRPQEEFHDLAAGAILVLLIILMFFNSIAIYMRERSSKNRGKL